MKFALLGMSRHALNLVRTIGEQQDHTLVAAYDIEEEREELDRLAPLAASDDDWESLLLGTVADAVIVVGRVDDERRADQLRKLVQAAVPLLVVHPACATLVGYELEMIRQDTGCVLVPFIPGSLHPAIAYVQSLVRQATTSPIGCVEQLVLERTHTDRSRENVLAMLTWDAELVRQILGDVKQLNAMGAQASEPSYANLSVHMQGSAETLARWSIGPADNEPYGHLALLGSSGKLTLRMPDCERQWTLEISAAKRRTFSYLDWDPYRRALEIVCGAIRSDTKPQPSWSEACRGLDIVSAVEQSLRRGRTVEIFDEELSEEQTFKGIMAMGGCGILLAALLLLFGLAAFEGLALPLRPAGTGVADDHAAQVQRAPLLLRFWPFYPFAAFLLLQLLRLVFRRERTKAKTASNNQACRVSI